MTEKSPLHKNANPDSSVVTTCSTVTKLTALCRAPTIWKQEHKRSVGCPHSVERISSAVVQMKTNTGVTLRRASKTKTIKMSNVTSHRQQLIPINAKLPSGLFTRRQRTCVLDISDPRSHAASTTPRGSCSLYIWMVSSSFLNI
jgi:hypothetical protein